MEIYERIDMGVEFFELDFWGDRPSLHEEMTGANEITDADRAAAQTPLDLHASGDQLGQELAASRSPGADDNSTAVERAREQANEEIEDPASHWAESATTPPRAQPDPTSEGLANTDGIPRGHGSHDSLHTLVEESESSDQPHGGE